MVWRDYCTSPRSHSKCTAQKGASPESEESSDSNFPHKSKTTRLKRCKHSSWNPTATPALLCPSLLLLHAEKSGELLLTWWVHASALPLHPCRCWWWWRWRRGWGCRGWRSSAAAAPACCSWPRRPSRRWARCCRQGCCAPWHSGEACSPSLVSTAGASWWTERMKLRRWMNCWKQEKVLAG